LAVVSQYLVVLSQSAWVAQAFRHPVDAHGKSPQSWVLVAGQAPAPSQVAAGVKMPLLQEAWVQM
jgi:hypothetical protein